MSAIQFFGGLWLGAAIATPSPWLKAICFVVAATASSDGTKPPHH